MKAQFLLALINIVFCRSFIIPKSNRRALGKKQINDKSNYGKGFFIMTTMLPETLSNVSLLVSEISEISAEPVGYSKLSYYATLGLYVLSFPGLWSVIKRAAKTKYKERIYLSQGPNAAENPKPTKQVAAEIIAYFQANNYKIVSAGQEILFEGAVQASKSQAFFLVFCTFLCLGTLALVLQIQFPEVGNLWYFLTLISPYAGVYYWNNASRKEKAQVKLELNDDESEIEINITAAEEELDRMATTMGYMQKGMVRVKGILEANQ
mmetsp:Transcript_19436/g.28803  ORF Transcript_19436/g.28803 Transcript_19436/m.28803 type:complete len:265 (+) Transcript_19436:27-821(+)